MNPGMGNTLSSLYGRYVMNGELNARDERISYEKSCLLESMLDSPDYHPEILRNGIEQGMLLTRGGEKHTYNVICKPEDELFAGDIIDAFGSKWIVMEARADKTTHKTGIMQQCNYKVKFQNRTSEVFERYGYLDISGYSASFNKDAQLQKGEEQVAIYLPYDQETEKLFVDKRIASHVGYDPDGNKMLFAFRITGVNPVSESFNSEDHLLMLKAVRDLYSSSSDNIDEVICDYIPSDKPETPIPPTPDQPQPNPPPQGNLLDCEIVGKNKIRIGTSRTFKCAFYDSNGDKVVVTPIWTIDDGHNKTNSNDQSIKVSVPDDYSRIGESIIITLSSSDGLYRDSIMEVEVIGYV